MKIYKYRNLCTPDTQTFKRIYQIILQNKFWCASPASLNDKDEFQFKFDCTPTDATIRLLPQLLMRYNNTPADRAQFVALLQINNNKLEDIAIPIIKEMIINKCRNEIGLVCFSRSKNDVTLWKRYGGCGNGLCIEIDVPDNTLGDIFREVDYVAEKVLHIDGLLESALFDDKRIHSYQKILLTKSLYWKPEDEVRIVTKKQNVLMTLKDSTITEITIGTKVCRSIVNEIKSKVNSHFQAHIIEFTEVAQQIHPADPE